MIYEILLGINADSGYNEFNTLFNNIGLIRKDNMKTRLNMFKLGTGQEIQDTIYQKIRKDELMITLVRNNNECRL